MKEIREEEEKTQKKAEKNINVNAYLIEMCNNWRRMFNWFYIISIQFLYYFAFIELFIILFITIGLWSAL